MKLFSIEKNQQTLKDFVSYINQASFENECLKNRLDIIKPFLKKIQKHPERWDSNCPFNITHVGDDLFQNIIIIIKNQDIESINIVYVLFVRFITEYELATPETVNFGVNFESIRRFIKSDTNDLDSQIQDQLKYTFNDMPFAIIRFYFNDPNINSFRNFEDTKQNALKLHEQWLKDISSTETRVNEIKKSLEDYETGFNFVGLEKGFSSLLGQKNKELATLKCFLRFMAAGIILPLLVMLIYTLFKVENDTFDPIKHLAIFIPLLSIELLLIYFFRIILVNHKSVKTQILQIELRSTLCQFIQSYAKNAATMKGNDKSSLEKFENLIFSSILSDSDKMPSTFDGLDQISNLMKSLKA